MQSSTTARSSYSYDETGQVISATDPNGHPTFFSYADNYSGGGAPGQTNTYLTGITYPNTGISHVEGFGYRYADGQLAFSIDQNGVQTSYAYNDSLGRLTETDYADGGKTTISYNDTAPSPSITTTQLLTTSSSLVSQAIEDGVGTSPEVN